MGRHTNSRATYLLSTLYTIFISVTHNLDFHGSIDFLLFM